MMAIKENVVEELLCDDIIISMGGATGELKSKHVTSLEKCEPLTSRMICMMRGIPYSTSDVIVMSFVSVF